MNQPRKPKKVKAPEGCKPHFTAGKEYDVYDVNEGGNGGFTFYLKSDNNKKCFCLEKGCSHLDEGDWIVTEYED